MKRRTRKALVLVAGAATLAILPVVATVWYAHARTVERARERLTDISAAVCRRVEHVLMTNEAAIADVLYEGRAGCTSALIREMRRNTIGSADIRGMGYVNPAGRVECTAFGLVDPPMPVDHDGGIAAAPGVVFTPPRPVLFAPGPLVTASYRLPDGAVLVAAFAPESLVDVVRPDALGADGRLWVTVAGVEIAAIGVTAPRAPDFLMETRDVGVHDARVTAAASRAWALADWSREATVTGSIGAAAGVVLAGAAARLGRKRLSLAAELRDALENNEFEIWYQPVIDLQHDRCSGAEALIRWRHPERDLVAPDLFIALAEDTGIIIPMTRWLMTEVGRQLGGVLREQPDLHIAINLAPAHVASFDIVEDAKRIIAGYGIRPSQILFELTERGLIDDPACRSVVEALSALGSGIAVDDFGTGYSSLAYIDKFKLDYLKIDKAFVSAVGDSSPAARLTDIIIEMARSLGLKTIAEGVETPQQVSYLRAHGVDFAQGWYFSRAVTAADFLAFLEGTKPGPSASPAAA